MAIYTANALKAVKEKINTPEKWTKGMYARDIYGNDAGLSGRDAVCWCLSGAIMACYPPSSILRNPVEKAIIAAAAKKGYMSSYLFNDAKKTTHEDVMKFLDELIEMEQGEQS